MGELTFKKPDTPAWDAMWAWLAAHPMNAGQAEPTVAYCSSTGEVWQYMGTYDGFDEFRHRHHPRTSQRVYVRRPV
jgi:hypothetical protein